MIFLSGTSGFHYGQLVLQIHLSVGQVDFLTKFDPCASEMVTVIALLPLLDMHPAYNIITVLWRVVKV